MKDNLDNDKKLETAIDAMEHDADRLENAINTPDADEDLKAACRDIALIEKVLLRQCHRAPDVEAELDKVLATNRKHTRRAMWRRIGWWTAAGVAAMLALVFILRGTDVNEASTSLIADSTPTADADEITLRIGDATTLSLEQLAEGDLQRSGATLDEGGEEMTYAGTHVGEVVHNTLSVPRRKDFKVVLADGTEVWLNAESRLTYPNRFTDGERRVKLQGEAYFKVAVDRQHPFVVETDYMQSEVLGTEFNVRTYTADDCHVTLVKGGVRVSDAARRHVAELRPGQDARLEPDAGFVLTQVDTEAYTAWKDGLFYFDQATLADIMRELGRWYDADVTFEASADKNFRMRFLADRRGSLEQVLDLLNGFGRVTATYDAATRRITVK